MNLIEKSLYNFKKLLNEQISPVAWHFCDLKALGSILRTNTFKLKKSEVDRETTPGITGYSPKRPYYMCLTRSKNPQEGYSKIFSDKDNLEGYVRLTINGDALNNIAHGKASDYFGSRDNNYIVGKRALYKDLESPTHKTIKQLYNQRYTSINDNEKEDTVWYNKSTISNASKYILKIDVYITTEQSVEENKNLLYNITKRCERLNIPLKFHYTFDKSSLKESVEDDIDYSFTNYQNNYPNDIFDIDDVSREDLINFCKTNDFFYILNGLGELKLRVCNTNEETRAEIVDELSDYNTYFEPTHEFDSLIKNRMDFDDYYVIVFKINTPNDEYAIVYETEKH